MRTCSVGLCPSIRRVGWRVSVSQHRKFKPRLCNCRGRDTCTSMGGLTRYPRFHRPHRRPRPPRHPDRNVPVSAAIGSRPTRKDPADWLPFESSDEQHCSTASLEGERIVSQGKLGEDRICGRLHRAQDQLHGARPVFTKRSELSCHITKGHARRDRLYSYILKSRRHGCSLALLRSAVDTPKSGWESKFTMAEKL